MLLRGSRLLRVWVAVSAVVVLFAVSSDSAARIVKLRSGTGEKMFDEYKQNHQNYLQRSFSTPSKAKVQISDDFGTGWNLRTDRPYDYAYRGNGRLEAEPSRSGQTRPVNRLRTQTVGSYSPSIVRASSNFNTPDPVHHTSRLLQPRGFGNPREYVDQTTASPTRFYHGGSEEFVKEASPSPRIQSRYFFSQSGRKTSDPADMKQESPSLASHKDLKQTPMRSYLFQKPSLGQDTIKPDSLDRLNTLTTTTVDISQPPSVVLQENLQEKAQTEMLANFSERTKNQPALNINLQQTVTQPPTQLPEKDTIPQHFRPRANFRGSGAPGSETPAATAAPIKESSPEKSLFGLRWSESPWRPNMKENSNLAFPSIPRNRPGFSFNKNLDNNLKMTKVYPALSPKYSFGQRRLATTPAAPKTSAPESTTTPHAVLNLTKTFSLERDDSLGRKRVYKSHKRIYSLNGFGRRTGLSPQKAKVTYEPKGSASQEVQNSLSLKPKPNVEMDATAKQMLTTLSTSTLIQQQLHQPASDKLKKVYILHGFRPPHKAAQGPGTTTSRRNVLHFGTMTPRVVAGYYQPERVQHTISPLIPSPGADEMKGRLMNSFTSGMVKATRVTGRTRTLNPSPTSQNRNVSIVRLPKRPTLIKAVTYADVLGSASFSGVRADPSLSHKGNQSRLDLRALGGDQKLQPQNETKVHDLFSDDEGSGSGGSLLTYKSSTEDENDLEYISTSDMFFKSSKVPLSRK